MNIDKNNPPKDANGEYTRVKFVQDIENKFNGIISGDYDKTTADMLDLIITFLVEQKETLNITSDKLTGLRNSLTGYKNKGAQSITLTDSEKSVIDKVVSSPIDANISIPNLLTNIYDKLKQMDNKPFSAEQEKEYDSLFILLETKKEAWKLSNFDITEDIKTKIRIKSKMEISPNHLAIFQKVLGQDTINSPMHLYDILTLLNTKLSQISKYASNLEEKNWKKVKKVLESLEKYLDSTLYKNTKIQLSKIEPFQQIVKVTDSKLTEIIMEKNSYYRENNIAVIDPTNHLKGLDLAKLERDIIENFEKYLEPFKTTEKNKTVYKMNAEEKKYFDEFIKIITNIPNLRDSLSSDESKKSYDFIKTVKIIEK